MAVSIRMLRARRLSRPLRLAQVPASEVWTGEKAAEQGARRLPRAGPGRRCPLVDFSLLYQIALPPLRSRSRGAPPPCLPALPAAVAGVRCGAPAAHSPVALPSLYHLVGPFRQCASFLIYYAFVLFARLPLPAARQCALCRGARPCLSRSAPPRACLRAAASRAVLRSCHSRARGPGGAAAFSARLGSWGPNVASAAGRCARPAACTS